MTDEELADLKEDLEMFEDKEIEINERIKELRDHLEKVEESIDMIHEKIRGNK